VFLFACGRTRVFIPGFIPAAVGFAASSSEHGGRAQQHNFS
jgi:hypothetical protein